MWSRTAFLRAAAPHVETAYRVLGIEVGSPMGTVKARYLELARQYHPDLNGGDDTRMKAVNVAYETAVDNFGKEAPQSTGSASTAGTETGSYAKRYGMRKPKAQPTTVSDHEAWATRSEFDWVAATSSVSSTEAADPKNHPDSFNKHFSWDDDVAIFEAVRSGASVAQVGRSLGKTPLAIEKRLNSPQFKQRIRRAMKAEKIKKGPSGAREKVFRSSDPLERVAVRGKRTAARSAPHHHDPLGFGDDEAAAHRWTADQVVSPIGKSYSNFTKFHKKGASSAPGHYRSRKHL